MLHVGGLVHADGQFDPQICVLAVLRDHHPVELRLLWTTGGGDQDHLKVGEVIQAICWKGFTVS